MKRLVGLIVDSTFGLDIKYAKKYNITIVPLKVLIDDKEYIDGELDPELVIQALREGKQVKTSQPAPELFMQAINHQLIEFSEVIVLTLSKTLSGTNNSANLALTIMGNHSVHVVDSETTINGGVFLVQQLITYLEEGASSLQALTYLEELKRKGSIIFTVDNLQTLVLNGRLGRISAFIGNILKVKPILRFDQGVLELEHKTRSFSNVKLYIINEVKKLQEKGNVIIRIGYVDTSVQAKELEHEIFQLGEGIDVALTGYISPVIAAHVGLGGLGVYLTYTENA
jgi:DegV family protein with EDD domain